MKIIEKIAQRQQDQYSVAPTTIAFLGDSVTHGAFELFNYTGVEGMDTVHEYSSVYPTRLREMLNLLYPKAQINIINAGIAGDNAQGGLKRLEQDVLQYKPDLVVVSFGLNDVTVNGLAGKDKYIQTIKEILLRIKESGAEAIYLTENYMNSRVSLKLAPSEYLTSVAKSCCITQNEGHLKAYFEGAKEMCAEIDVPVCDIYHAWEIMEKCKVDTTNLLANHLNHPVRELHYYTAIKLLEMICSK